MQKTETFWFVYLLQCMNGRIYTGITTDVEQRLKKHKSGKGAMFTRRNKPSHILAAKVCASRSEASKLEVKIKKLNADQKKELVAHWLATGSVQ